MTVAQYLGLVLLVVDYTIKIVAVGTVPENRRPSSSQAWLLLILLLPAVGLPLFLLIGSPRVRGRRSAIQQRAHAEIETGLEAWPTVPIGAEVGDHLHTLLEMNRELTALPCVTGTNQGLFADSYQAIADMAVAVRKAQHYVHVEMYIMAWDEATDDFFVALSEAVDRGVEVRLLMDHIGSRKYPGWRAFRRRLTAASIDWHLMMPIDLLRGKWRRPDLRNHRKITIIDGEIAFMGSMNMIHPSYDSKKNKRIGREWKDLTVKLTGDIVPALQSVFMIDWYAETGERLDSRTYFVDQPDVVLGGSGNVMQAIPSGPGFTTEPSLRLFTALVHQAEQELSITSPYFVPDESLLGAITTAAYRGVKVDLFVGEKADQFMVHHAQRSYYHALLEAGVRIHLYPEPAVLHAKCMTVDDRVAIIGSSNMDFRSFLLDYEITLLGFGGDLVTSLRRNNERYLALSRELTLAEWSQEPWYRRYIDNVMRLTSALQ